MTVVNFGQSSKSGLAIDDKSEIVTSALINVFRDFPEQFQTAEVFLSAKNIDDLSAPKLDKVKLIVLSPDEIEKKIIRDGSLDYLVFTNLEVKKGKVFVTLESTRTVLYKSAVTPVSGHGFIYEYKKKAGKWIGENTDTSSFITCLCDEGSN